jgi:hypothetical protein
MIAAKLWFLAAILAAPVLCADQAAVERGQKEEARACTPCHSLRLIHSQRLSKAAWNKELDKMAGWGTVFQERDALLEYLMASYGDDKPLPAPATSGDGVKKAR